MEFNIFDPVSLTEALNQNLPPKRFLSKTFFGTRYYSTRQIGVDIIKGTRRIAPFVRAHQAGTAVQGQEIETKFFEPGQINLHIRTDAVDAFKRAAGENISYANGEKRNPASVFQDIVARDQQELIDSAYRTIEKMCSDAIFTGVVNMHDQNGGLIDSIDLGLAGTHNLTLASGSGWNEASTDPLKDLRAWKRLVTKDSGLNATDAVFGSSAYDAFIANASVKDYLDKSHIDLGSIAPGDISDDGATLMGRVNGLNIWVVDDWFIDPSTGSEAPLVPEEKVAVIARNLRANVHFGLINDVDAGNFEGELFTRIYKEPDGSAQNVQLRSAPLATIEQINGIVVADVVV